MRIFDVIWDSSFVVCDSAFGNKCCASKTDWFHGSEIVLCRFVRKRHRLVKALCVGLEDLSARSFQ